MSSISYFMRRLSTEPVSVTTLPVTVTVTSLTSTVGAWVRRSQTSSRTRSSERV